MRCDIIKKLSRQCKTKKAESIIAGISNLVPYVGGLIGEGTHVLFERFQEKKRNEFLDVLLSDKELITSEMANNIEFIMNFAKTLEVVNRLATNDKIVYFANLIKNGYFVENRISNDDFEEYLSILQQLSFDQINALFCIGEYLYQTKSPSLKELVRICEVELGISSHNVTPTMYTLQNTGLILPFPAPSGMVFFKEDTVHFRLQRQAYAKFKSRIVGEKHD